MIEEPFYGRLPDDEVLGRLIRFGFTYGDIARRFHVNVQAVSIRAQRLGFEPLEDREICRRSALASSRRFSPLHTITGV